MPRQTRRKTSTSSQQQSSPAPSSTAPSATTATATASPAAAAPYSPEEDAGPSEFFKSLAPAELMQQVEEHPEQFHLNMIHVDDIVPNPFNPPRRGESEDELADLLPSVRRDGVLSPVLVVERSVVLANSPDLNVAAGGTYVSGHGWRRRCAARMADKPWVPAIVHNEFASARRLNQLVVIENLGRKNLSFLEEAEVYQNLIDDGQTVEEVARDIGRGKSHISKRKSLLQLTDMGKQLLEAGEINNEGALTLLSKLKDKTRQDAALHAATHRDAKQRMTLAAAIAQESQRADQERQEVQLRAQLTADEIDEIDPDALWGDEAWQHRLDETEIEGERAAGTLAGATVTHGRLLYYSTGVAPRFAEHHSDQRTTEVPDRTDSEATDATPSAASEAAPSESAPSPSGPETAVLRNADEHTDASAARREACRRLVEDYTTLKDKRRNDCIAILADAVLLGVPRGTINNPEVGTWADITNPSLELEQRDAQRLALASAIACLEDHASEKRYAADPWSAVADRHVRRLADLGYHRLSRYEETKLATD